MIAFTEKDNSGGDANLKEANQELGFRHSEFDILVRHPSRGI